MSPVSQYQTENHCSQIIACEKERRPLGIEKVQLRLQLDPLSLEWRSIEQPDQEEFRTQLLALLAKQCAKHDPEWRNPQGAPVRDFTGFALVEKYLSEVWIYPLLDAEPLQPQTEWIFFAYPAGPF